MRVVVQERRRLIREVLAELLDAEDGVVVVASVARPHDVSQIREVFDTVLVVGQAPDAPARATATRTLHFTDEIAVDRIVDVVVGRASPGATQAAEQSPLLTRRETQVLQGIAGGLSAADIATRLGIAPKSVENHTQRMFVKLRVQSRAHAVAVGLERGELGAAGATG